MELDDNSLIYRSRSFSSLEVKIEKESEHHIFNILDWVFNKNLFSKGDKNLSNFDFRLNSDCDILLSKKDDQKFRFVDIEIKKPNVINKSMFKKKRLDELFNTNMVTNKNGNVLNCVKQIYKYISTHNLKYGILTTLNESWFFKLTNDKKTLSISDTIDIKDFLKAIYYLIKEILVPELPQSSILF
jgi:hypothetical protein